MSRRSSREETYEGRNREVDMMRLASAFFDNLERNNCEYGGWGVNSKRPFGNSYVEGDILEIIGLEVDDENEEATETACAYAAGLYDDLGSFLTKMWHKAYGTTT